MHALPATDPRRRSNTACSTACPLRLAAAHSAGLHLMKVELWARRTHRPLSSVVQADDRKPQGGFRDEDPLLGKRIAHLPSPGEPFGTFPQGSSIGNTLQLWYRFSVDSLHRCDRE